MWDVVRGVVRAVWGSGEGLCGGLVRGCGGGDVWGSGGAISSPDITRQW